ncbi:hypothetical protein CLV78_1111 [Aliiruegeria haliotis]|uniref:Uncharacterized protein n=1 Tax=Aliiruegeria haliotis TaxID=1280846 RepID=A0A2T0RI62_9RHOB|nr:hypothetical protein [Aliiruegeria haliotis]PRY20848.1 hypothetical protein CLV78_1111 [Aliiruegeria haliotis]
MIEFKSIPDDHPDLGHSPLLRGAEAIFRYMTEHGSIGLTQTKAFKREFVTWAVREIDWPGHTEAELLRVNKVLNEADVLPLELLHYLYLELKLARHYKGTFRATRAGTELFQSRGKLFGVITPFYLMHVDHSWTDRFGDSPVGSWDIWLNVLNVETENVVSGSELFEVFYGKPGGKGIDAIHAESVFFTGVLRPLTWIGLLARVETGQTGRWRERHFIKTPLWHSALTLDTDAEVAKQPRH